MKKKILIGVLAIFLLIQFMPSELPEVIINNPDDLLLTSDVPEEIALMLKSSCYDCHSNATRYPWYSYVAPVSFLVERDTYMGRDHLNFSLWNSLEREEKADALYEMAEEVEAGEMPMKIYPIMHWDASLSDEERQAIAKWAEDAAEKLYE